MNEPRNGQRRIGTSRIDGAQVEFVWAQGTSFITAQFTDRAPRGIANVARIDTDTPVIVPMSSHHDWLNDRGHAQALINAGRACFTAATSDPDPDRTRGRPPRRPTSAHAADRNCETALPFMNGRSDRPPARTR